MSEKKRTMKDFVADCPQFIRDNVANSVELTKPVVDEYVSGNYKNIWIVACGSSSNGAMCARQFVRRHLNCECKIVTPFQFVSSENNFAEDDMVVCCSQSGYSTNILEAVQVVKNKGRRAVGLTGDVNSDLKDCCDVVANWGVGRETVGYVTRGVTTLALFFMLFAIEAAAAKGLKTAEEAKALKDMLLTAADVNEQVQKDWAVFEKEHYQSLSSMTNCYTCGVGSNIGTVMEGALKFGETISVPTAAYEAEEYNHGPNIQLTPKYTVFLVDGGEGSDRIHQLFKGTRIVTPNAYLLTCNNYDDDANIFHVDTKGILEEMTPLAFLPVFQLCAYDITNDLNRWIKHPLQEQMEKFVSSKSANYVNSPFSEDTPRREG